MLATDEIGGKMLFERAVGDAFGLNLPPSIFTDGEASLAKVVHDLELRLRNAS